MNKKKRIQSSEIMRLVASQAYQVIGLLVEDAGRNNKNDIEAMRALDYFSGLQHGEIDIDIEFLPWGSAKAETLNDKLTETVANIVMSNNTDTAHPVKSRYECADEIIEICRAHFYMEFLT